MTGAAEPSPSHAGLKGSFDAEPLRGAVVGCGEVVNRNRASALQRAAGTSLEVAMDVREWAAEDIADRADASYTTSLEDLLADDAVDFVYIATPHHLHADQVVAAAEAGKHVVVEKPLATTLADADRAVEACARNDVKLSVMLPKRFAPEVRRARSLIEEGAIGDVIGHRIQTMSNLKTETYWEGGYSGRVESDWRQSWEESGGGMLIMTNVHDVDLTMHLTGLEPARVSVEFDTFDAPAEVEDFLSAVVRYENGAIGTVETSSCIDAVPEVDTPRENYVYGREGTVVVSDPLWYCQRGDRGSTWHRETFDRSRGPLHEPVAVFNRFARAVRRDASPPAPGREFRRVLEFIRTAYESGREGETVAV